MDSENMKNMVVLKNLPSNIVEEAIVILKPNIKLKSLDTVPKNNKNKKGVKTENSKKYIINEAEMLVSNYISLKMNKKIEDKYKRLKIISIFLGVMLFASFWIK